MHDFSLVGQDWIGLIIFKNLRIRAGSDSISSDQDRTRTEKFYSRLISAAYCNGATTENWTLPAVHKVKE